MPHDKLTGVGVATKLTRKKRAVIVIGVVLHVHRVPPQAGQHLAQPLPVLVVLVQAGSGGGAFAAGIGRPGFRPLGLAVVLLLLLQQVG